MVFPGMPGLIELVPSDSVGPDPPGVPVVGQLKLFKSMKTLTKGGANLGSIKVELPLYW
jgi:hypothetical protein